MSCHYRGLFRKDVAQYSEEVEYVGSLKSVSTVCDRGTSTHVLELYPSSKIRVINSPLRINMLACPDHHSLHRRYIGYRLDLGILVRYPYCDGEAICRSSE